MKLMLLALVLSPQDLFQREQDKKETRAEKRVTRDRIELSLAAPMLRKNRGSTIQVGAQVDGRSSFLCGRFDALAGIRDLVSSDLKSRASSMLIDMAEGEIAANGMTMLCQVSPTLCDVLKHYRFSAQALLQMNYDKCRAIDQAIDDARSGMAAQAMRDCLARKQVEGKSLPEALRSCEREALKFKGFDGRYVASVDLNKELAALFGRDSEPFLPELNLSTRGINGKLPVNPVEPEYAKAREVYLEKWHGIIATVSAGGTPAPGALESLTPEWASFRPARQDLAAIAALPESRRTLLLEQLASDLAVLDVARRIADLDRRLAVASLKAENDGGTPPALAKHIAAQRKELNEALAELMNSRRLASMAGRAYSDLLGAIQAEQTRTARRNIASTFTQSHERRDPGIGKGFLPTDRLRQPDTPKPRNDLIMRVAKKRTRAKKEPCCTGTVSWGEK